MRIVFLDTNIFLHYKSLEQIDWLKEFKTTSCKIVVAPIILDELDKYKRELGTRGKRAKKAFQKIKDFKNKKIVRENVHFEIYLKKPKEITYERNELNFREQDHRLIATMIEYSSLLPEDDLIFYSDDFYPRLLVEEYGFTSIEPSSKYKLPKQKTEEEKKVLNLQQEIENYKNKLPELEIMFTNRKKHISFQNLCPMTENFDKTIEFLLDGLKKEYPFLTLDHNFGNDNMFFSSNLHVKFYNKALKDYFSDYKNYLTKTFKKYFFLSRSILLQIQLNNTGTFKSENTHVHLYLPKGIKIFSLDDIEKLHVELEEPVPPEMPQSRYDTIRYHRKYNRIKTFDDINDYNSMYFNVDYRSKETVVNFYLNDLKHNYESKFANIYLFFSITDSIKNFSFNYSVTCDNLPKPIIGNLNVSFYELDLLFLEN